MTSAARLDADVAVVGYGPAGKVLAILLARQGHHVVVLERFPEPYELPRAVHHDQEVARIFQACGLGDDLPAIGEAADVYEWRNGEGTILLRFGGAGDGVMGWPPSTMANQPALEALLDERVRAAPDADLHLGVEVTGLSQHDDGVVLTGTRADGTTVEVHSRFAVGCDGANSTVRGLLGIQLEDLGFFYDWLIVDVIPHEPVVWDPINLQVCDPARPTTAVSGGPGRRRWEFMRLPHERIDELDDEAVAWSLLEPWGVTPADAALERHAVYTFAARYAAEWRDARVLLAGDAAHQMPPFAGQGMCAGVRDAANLSWKLHLVLRGLADEDLLDTYDEERLPHVRAVIDVSMALGRVICVPDLDEAAARDEAMSAAYTGEPTEPPPLLGLEGRLFDAEDPGSGQLLPQGRVVRGAVAGRFDDVVGPGWRLVTVDAEPLDLDGEVADWWAALGGELCRVGPDGELADADETYARWFDEVGMRWALQRPDFVVAGTAADVAGARRLVGRVHGRLTSATVAT